MPQLQTMVGRLKLPLGLYDARVLPTLLLTMSH
jgi:hypothetical protein